MNILENAEKTGAVAMQQLPAISAFFKDETHFKMKKGGNRVSHPRSPELIAHVRSHVLSASARLYLEKGFTRATVKDIAAASGIGLPLLMRVMKSKEDILSELVNFVLESQFDAAK